jgi:hypothetical protein
VLHLPSALRNKNNSHLEAILTSLSAVLHAARQGKNGNLVTMVAATKMIAIATNLDVKCFLRYAQSVAKLLRYLSSLMKTGRFIVAIATIRSD